MVSGLESLGHYNDMLSPITGGFRFSCCGGVDDAAQDLAGIGLCRLAGGAGRAGAAQETTGTIIGAVSDQTGGVLPGTTIQIKHLQTGRIVEQVANEDGRYTAPLLQPGSYEVTFTLAGLPAGDRQGHRAARQRPPRDQRQTRRRRRQRDRSQVSAASSVRAANAGRAEPDGADAGPGTPAEQPQLRAAGDARAGRVERPVGRSRHRPDEHGQHLDQRRPPQRGQLARGRRVERGRRLEHHAAVARRRSNRSRSSRSSRAATRPSGPAAAAASSTS